MSPSAFHPPRVVIVSPSAYGRPHDTAVPVARRFAHQPCEPTRRLPDLHAVSVRVQTLDQKEMRLLVREQSLGRAGYVVSPGADWVRAAFRKSHADRSHSPAKNPVKKMTASGKLGAAEPHLQINAVRPINV